MSVGKLTKRDLIHLSQEYQEEILPAVEEGTYDGPIVVMTSLGYVNLDSDGDVVMYGEIIGNVCED